MFVSWQISIQFQRWYSVIKNVDKGEKILHSDQILEFYTRWEKIDIL